jgi:hypothetical protein
VGQLADRQSDQGPGARTAGVAALAPAQKCFRFSEEQMAMILPDRIVEAIADPTERKRHVTAQEGSERYALSTERQMHSLFSSYCLLHGILFEHENPSKRSTARPGWPDYRLFAPGGHFMALEFKVRPNRLSDDQEAIKAELEGRGFRYVVAYSLLEAIYAVQAHLLKAL